MHPFQKSILLTLILAVLCSLPMSDIRLCAQDDILDHIVFFGDSTTAHLANRGGIPSDHVWSGAGNTVLFETVNRTKCVHLEEENTDLSLKDAVMLKKPEFLVITLGVSGGAGFLPKEVFVGIYREMLESVQEASPETKIIVQSILPLSDKSVKHFQKLTRDAVLEANSWISELCTEMNIPYVDTHSKLVDDNGYLRIIYQNDEYMHLTRAAYTVVLDSIREAVSSYFHL